MLVCISSMQYKSHCYNTRCTGSTEGGIWSSHEEKEPLVTHYRVLWLSGSNSCQLSWDLWRAVVMEDKGKKQNRKIKARHQWYGHQYTGLASCTPWSHWLAEYLVTSLHLYGFQHPNQSTQGKSFLGKHYELHLLSGINVEAMAL